MKFITNIQEGRKINKNLVKMILDRFRGREKVGPQEQEGHTEVPLAPNFLENLGLEKLNPEFLPGLFSLFAEFKDRFPELDIRLDALVKIVKENIALLEEFYNSLLRLYFEKQITLEELKTKITEHPLYQKIADIFRLEDRESGKGEVWFAIILLIGLLFITAAVVGFGNFGIGQVLKLEKLIKALAGRPTE